MITYIAYAIFGALGLKITWNLAVPYSLAYTEWRTGKKGSSTSLMLLVEWLLLALAVVYAAITDGESWLHDPVRSAMIGGGLIIVSYVHFYVGGALVWSVEKLLGRKSEGRGSSDPK